MSKNKKRKGEILFLDARNLGEMVTRRHRQLSDDELKTISSTYHKWKGTEDGDYEDVKGYCKSAKLEEVEKHEFILTPGRYVGIADAEEDAEPFEEKMDRLTKELSKQFEKSDELEQEIKKNLKGLGWEI